MKFRTLVVLLPLSLAAGLLACTAPVDPRAAAFANLPDWRGIWVSERGVNTGISGFTDELGQRDATPLPLLDPAGPWTDAGRERMRTMQAGSTARKAPGWGYPMMMIGPAPLQFIITPEETLIVNIYQEVRHIYTDGRAHPKEEDRWVTTWGDSVGRWEGDTLVVDTISVREPVKFFQMVPPFTDGAHYTERLRMTAPDRIDTEITVEDPLTLSRPLTVRTFYTRTPNLDRLVHDAFDNDRSEVEGNAFTIAPPKQ
jgi:hypothetical protein